MTVHPTRAVRVSPRHHVLLDADYLPMIDRAPREDFVVRTIARRSAGNTPLMTGDLVIAGAGTRTAHPLAEQYPLHFRKTYYPGRLGDPRVELAHHERASEIVPVPPPIGCTRDTFRSCLLPGMALDRLTDLGTEPASSNVARAQALPLATAAGLWRLLEDAFETLRALQAGGLTHGDAHPHNFVVCPSPLEVLPVDFEQSVTRVEVGAAAFDERCQTDRDRLLVLAVYLQCALGQQAGTLAHESLARLEQLVTPADPFRQAITERTYGEGLT